MRALFLLVPLLCGFTTQRVGTTSNSVRWASDQVTYYVDQSGISSMPGDSDIAAAFQAMAAWNAAPCSTFRFVNGGTISSDAGASMQSIRFVHGAGSWPTGPGTVAYTARIISGNTTITQADVFVNDFEFDWSRSATLRSYDLQSVLTHELGHALGLQHSSDPINTMYWRGTKGSTFFRTLSADDIAGVCWLYPVSSAPCDGNEDCPMLDNGNGSGIATICSGGACVQGMRPYGEECLTSSHCTSNVCARFDGAETTSQTAPGLCSQNSCPCPNGDPCAAGVCAPHSAACNSATCEDGSPSPNDHCMVGLDGQFQCLFVCLDDTDCAGATAECFEPVSVADAGRCRVPGAKAVGDPCAAPSECATYICGVGLDGVAKCAAPDEVVDPPDPPPDTGGTPDGGPADGGPPGDGDGNQNGGDGFIADTDDPSNDPSGSVDGGCASASPSLALVMGAIVVALFVSRRGRRRRSNLERTTVA